MPRDYLPRRDADFLGFTSNLRARIIIAPSSFGVTPEVAAQYATAQDSFAQAFGVAIQPGTRTAPAVNAKNTARDILEARTRKVVNIIRAFPGISASDLADLGLFPLRGRPRRKHVAAPPTSPRLQVREVKGRRVSVQLTGRDALVRRKARDARGARLFAFVGDVPPVRIADWTYVKATTRTRTVVRVGPDVPPGTMVWLTAQWMNWRLEAGPLCNPVCAHVSYEAAVPGRMGSARPEVSGRRFEDQPLEALKLAA